jgi:hypothetical protein
MELTTRSTWLSFGDGTGATLLGDSAALQVCIEASAPADMSATARFV